MWSPLLKKWAEENQGHFDTAVAGRGSLQAGYDRAVLDELASADQQIVITLLWDMQKFCYTMDICKLVQLALHCAYPLHALGI